MRRPIRHLPATRRAITLAATTLAAALLGAAPAWAGKAHEHGAAKMDVALDGDQLTVALELPLDSLVGFERAPRSAAERQAAADALARLRDGAALIRLDAAAGCTLASASIEAPLLQAAAPAAATATAAPGDDHADAEVAYAFRCGQPARLTALELALFDVFRRVQRVDVQAALPHGQRKAVLDRKTRVLRLAR